MGVMVTNDEDTHTIPDLIVTHNTDRNREYPGVPFRRFLRIYHARSGLGQLPPENRISGGVTAFINGGRWVAGCDICHTALVVEPADPFFCCPSCGSGGVWRQVVFPTPEAKAALEALMLMRPGFRHSAPKRNWEPATEDLDTVRRQNIAAGDPVDQVPPAKED